LQYYRHGENNFWHVITEWLKLIQMIKQYYGTGSSSVLSDLFLKLLNKVERGWKALYQNLLGCGIFQLETATRAV
jgi:hypothetical protein